MRRMVLAAGAAAVSRARSSGSAGPGARWRQAPRVSCRAVWAVGSTRTLVGRSMPPWLGHSTSSRTTTCSMSPAGPGTSSRSPPRTWATSRASTSRSPRSSLARRRLADRIAAGTAEVVKGDAGALPWKDGRFTAIACMDAFPFFPDPDRALAEMCRVLRPGGRAVIDMNPRVPEGTESHLMRGPGGQFRAWNDADVRRMTEAAGFDDVAITHVPGTDSRLFNALSRRLFGTDEETIVVAVKPGSVPSVGGVRAEEPVAVG